MPDIEFLSFILFNARSLNNKLCNLHYLLRKDKPHVVCITETWLQPETPDSLIVDDCNYSVFRTDRSTGHPGGGVCILTCNDSLKVIPVHLPSDFSHLELCIIDIFLNDVKLRLFVCYRPPSGNSDPQAVQYVKDVCNCIVRLFPANSPVIICGDFNLPNIDWSADNCKLCSDSTCSGVMVDFVYNQGLQQYVFLPTRNESILDVVFSNDQNCLFDVKTVEPFSTSDHNQVHFQVLKTEINSDHTYVIRNFKHADWIGIKEFLNRFDFNNLFQDTTSPDLAFGSFYDIINSCLDYFVPLKRIDKRSKKHSFKYPHAIERLLRKKATAWRVYRTFKTRESLSSFKSIAFKCKSAISTFVAEYESHMAYTGNVGTFYRYANKKFTCKSTVGPLQDEHGLVIVDPEHKATLLQRTFTSHYTIDNGRLPANVKNATSKLSRVNFTPSQVRRAIKRLNAKTAGGPDGIPPLFFIQCCDELVYPLSQLFTYSFENSILPAEWLQSIITPIFKKGAASDPGNYRPISLTATMCKLMESIVKDQLLTYLSDKGLINKHQHAFIKNHSTATNLLECLNDWLVSLHSKKRADVVYVDFSKAFDSIVTSKLLLKLECYGISGLLLTWIKCFLSNRTQRVAVDRCYSAPSMVLSGVPQGSVLGPLLFLIFINDIDTVCCGTCELQLFADDVKLYSNIDVDDTSDCLQQSLNNLSAWAAEWQLRINISKCAVLNIATRPLPEPSKYYLNGVAIAHHNSYVDLGVTICQQLTFNEHINNIVSKARQRTGVLFRGFITRNCDILRQAFISYVRPIIEYNTVVWSPCVKYLIDLLESVQRQFSKRIPSISDKSYADRLAVLNLETLELRRLRFDLIFYFKVFNNLTPFSPELVFTVYSPPSFLRTNQIMIQKPTHASEKMLSSTFYRCIDAWNYLPVELRRSQSLCIFKRGLKAVDLAPFLKGSVNE